MKLLQGNTTMRVPYEVPPTELMQVRVFGNDAVKVGGKLAKHHTFPVQALAGSEWYLVVENPWDYPVAVHYEVVELSVVLC
jgi:hypothetical protein